jgi:hypothetical protein
MDFVINLHLILRIIGNKIDVNGLPKVSAYKSQLLCYSKMLSSFLPQF